MRYDNTWSSARVAVAADVATDIRELRLVPDAGLRRYPAGAHVDVRIPRAGGDDIRSYSLVGPFDPAGYRIAVKLAAQGRGGSRHMWSLAAGDRIEISSPLSSFELGPRAPETLLIAAGIGITPILGMADELARSGAACRLHYCGRSRAHMAFLDTLREMLGDRLVAYPSDEARRLDLGAEIAALHPEGEAYVCGPMRLLDAARRLWHAASRPAAALRFETFGSSGHFAAEAFEVRIPRLDRTVTVAAGASMLEALEQAGIGVLADCRRGECGLCVLDVLATEGRIDHRDVFLSLTQREADTKICACVSRVAGGSGGNVITIDPAWRGDQPITI